MANFYARSVFFVADAERSLRYYTEQLGFSLDWDSNDGVFQLGLFGFELILNEVGPRTRARAGRGRLFIGLDDDQVSRSTSISRTNASGRSALNGGARRW